MKRRAFVSLCVGAATWPLAARAQDRAPPAVGFLRRTPAAISEKLVAAFRRGLKEEGFVEGENVVIEDRYADNRMDRLPALTADLLARRVALIAGDNVSAIAAKAATSTVPIIVVTAGDPVRSGLVASLNRPGGNVTGVSFSGETLGEKRLELLRQIVPGGGAIGVLVDPDTPTMEGELAAVEGAARRMGQRLTVLKAATDRDLDAALATVGASGVRALLVAASAFLNSRTEAITAAAARQHVPTMYLHREAVEAGGLMSYGTSLTEAYRVAGVYAGRILKGEKPADLPVVQAAKFEFVMNLKTARALGLDVPDRVLALADEVIE
jgi:putative ABC transport system substrate-binding protein